MRSPPRLRVALAAGALVAYACRAHVALAGEPVAAEPRREVEPLVPYPPPVPRVLAQPDGAYTYAEPKAYPSLLWIGLQLVPSPEVVVGRTHETTAAGGSEASTEVAFGLRWQITPIVWSWGSNRRITPWRFLVVDPLARHGGSLELSGGFEYIFGHVDRLIVRPGLRAYFPLVQRGEYLSFSIGTSAYAYDRQMRGAYEVGAYALGGFVGLQATVAPYHGPMAAIATLRLRSF